MIKVQNNTATRDPIPDFIRGLAPWLLADLSWTDPALGVADCAWWPEDDQSLPLGEFQRYGVESLAVDGERRVVIVVRAVEPWSASEIAEYQQARRGEIAEAIAARRYEAETAGIDIAGMHVDTDDRSKLLINGAALEAMIDPDYVMQWKTPAGFVELSAAQVLAVARAVRAHVQGCFDREAELLGTLGQGNFEPAMLADGWPG
ncbi:DUF4376 domain-containing protein [uncultured Pseudomonas sp.]|uniref:DUF4376 domain-containing protein n=1 Tax=uncultured Pseudomonas sp. TaxID=114707 RepID=UPI0025F00B8A|nr:DUF4376 domain-containing protein [uncultured Pseudomonas sp.]